MKVYVITSGRYSDYHIDAVAVDRDRAELLKKWYSRAESWSGDAKIEVFDTDEDGLIRGEPRRVWNFDINEKGVVFDGKEEWTFEGNFENQFGFSHGGLIFFAKVVARDKDVAKKIAIDTRTQMLAERFGLC